MADDGQSRLGSGAAQPGQGAKGHAEILVGHEVADGEEVIPAKPVAFPKRGQGRGIRLRRRAKTAGIDGAKLRGAEAGGHGAEGA